jgi:uncharacterized protein (TIGR02453 family)
MATAKSTPVKARTRKAAPAKIAPAGTRVAAQPRFTGFGKPTLRFLDELADNNERAWFAEHKPRYEADVLTPALDFIAAMSPRLAKLSDHFLAIPQRQGGSLMRPYKDTRFSRDKTPYKTNVGIQFRHELGKDVHAPGFYVHIEPGACFIGAGMWHPEPDALATIRARIVEAPDEWKKVRADRRFAAAWSLGGASLARPPRGVAKDHPWVEDLKRKDFIAGSDIGDDVVATPDFPAFVARQFAAAAPLMRFLCRTLELQY